MESDVSIPRGACGCHVHHFHLLKLQVSKEIAPIPFGRVEKAFKTLVYDAV